MHRFFVFMIVAVLAVSGCAVAGTPVRTPPTVPPVAEQTVELDPTADTEIAVSAGWTITVPAHAAPPGARFTVRKSERFLPAGAFEYPIASADLTLSSGQPSVPLVFRYSLPAPLPEDNDLYLVGRSGHGDDEVPSLTPIQATLDDARRTATATVPHLSTWDWIGADPNHFVGAMLGIRSGAPSCESQPTPEWFDRAIYLDDKNAPMRVCVGTDPKNRDLAVVKIRNNRGMAIIVTAPAVPVWVYRSQYSGQPADLAAEIERATLQAFAIPADVSTRTWVVPPGGSLDIGFSSASLPLTSKITAYASVWTVLYGLLWNLAEDAVDDPLAFSAMEVGFLAACAGSAADTLLGATEASQAAGGLAAAGLCLLRRAPDVLGEIASRLSDSAFENMRKRGIATKVGTATARYLPIVNAISTGYIVSDAIAATRLGEGAWQISLYKNIDAEYTLNALCGTVHDRRIVKHPSLGDVTVGIRRGAKSLAGEGCIAVVDTKGKKLLSQKVAVYGDALEFAAPVTDATSNVFLTYNPGRYNGVITLVPNATGYEDVGWGADGLNYRTTTHAYYFADLEGPGPDGRYSIKASSNDCRPSCAGGTITSKVLRWNGRTYS